MAVNVVPYGVEVVDGVLPSLACHFRREVLTSQIQLSTILCLLCRVAHKATYSAHEVAPIPGSNMFVDATKVREAKLL